MVDSRFPACARNRSLSLTLENDHKQRGDVDPVPHVEALPVRLDGTNEDEDEGFVAKQVIELAQPALHVLVLDRVLIVHLFVLMVVEERMVGIVGKENAHDESTIVQVRNARRLQVRVELCHIRLEEGEGRVGEGG